uniref:Somatostatin family member 7 n=1 Tax=Amphiprion percula TaxID=161767 RepID=A0A3P8TK19_AMPPE
NTDLRWWLLKHIRRLRADDELWNCPPTCLKAADEGEAYKRERDIGSRGEETSVASKSHEQPPPTALHSLHHSPLDLWLSLSCRGFSLTHTRPHTPAFFQPPVTVALVCHLHSCHSMQLLVVLAALMGVLFSVRAAAVLPVEDRSPIHVSRELSKERKELILKLVSGLLDGALDTNMLPGESVSMDLEEPLESRLEERAVYNRLSLPQRDRKAPCKNFFWKTFTSC